jgi:hypothetical protein
MNWIWLVIGTLLILIGLLDLFLSVLHYDRFGFISSRLIRGVWHIVRFVAHRFPQSVRAFVLSLGAPLMVPVVIFLWVGMEILGFALLYYAGMNPTNFRFDSGLEPGFWEALYLSGVSLATLGYGDVTPTSPVYQLLGFVQALIGFGILTLSLSYVLNIYQVLGQFSLFAAGLHHKANDSDDPRTIVVPYVSQNMPSHLGPYLMTLHQQLVSYYEGLRQYPIVFYFYSRRSYRSIPFTFHMIGEMTAALRWGLPRDVSVTQEAWLPPLLTAFSAITSAIEEQFISKQQHAPPEPVPFDTFVASFRRKSDGMDPWVKHFLDLDCFMRRVADKHLPVDLEEMYGRYTQWLPFAHQTSAFVKASAHELGYSLPELFQEPAKPRF